MKIRWKVRYHKADEGKMQESKLYKHFSDAYKIAQLYREAGMHAEILSVEVA